jgi:hypothetical protein
MSRLVLLPLCVLLASCGGEDIPPNAANNGAPASAGSAPAGSPKPVLTARTPGSEPVAVPNPAGPVRGPSDPAWLRANLFPGATVTSSGRTAPDPAGLFATQLLMSLPEAVTRDACVETLTNAVAKVVPTLERKDGPDDRVTLTGSNEDYAVTLVCGSAKGKMSAYLSYRWLRPPPPPTAAPATPITAPAPTAPAPTPPAPTPPTPTAPTSTPPTPPPPMPMPPT